MSKAKIIVAFLSIFLLFGCAHKNQSVATVTDSAKETIQMVVKDKPECKTVGDVCIKELEVVEKICNEEISNAKHAAWKRGFFNGMTLMVVMFVGVFLFLWRFTK